MKQDLYITQIEEKFDLKGNLRLQAGFKTADEDTIAEYGFIYTDGLPTSKGDESFRDPQMNTDHRIKSESLVYSDARNQFVFDALVNPERIHYFNFGVVVNVAAYIISTQGNTIISAAKQVDAPKVQINSIFPLFAAPGTLIKVEMNRRTESDSIFSADLYNSSAYGLSVLIEGENIPLETIQYQEFTFRMPAGLEAETPFLFKVGDYEVPFDAGLTSASRSFEFVTEFEREYSSNALLFALPGGLYFGGGEGESRQTLTDFWKFDLSRRDWSRIADYPSSGLGRGMAFTVNGKAYCGIPQNLDLYDPDTDSWTPVATPTTSLQYDHKFGRSASVAYKGNVYFTHFAPEVEVGVYYHNFHVFDPEKESYRSLAAYPGPGVQADYLDQAVVFEEQLHFFPGAQHWTYNVEEDNWFQLSDIAEGQENIKGFSYGEELYALRSYKRSDGMGRNLPYLGLLKYDARDDTWKRDADVPYHHGIREGYVVQTSPEDVYICMIATNNKRIIIYKLV